MTIAARLREERERAGIGQRELARRAGISRSTPWKVESNRRDVTLVTAKKLAEATGVELADLLLAGPPLFELEFVVGELDRPPPSPWLERRLLASVPEAGRRLTAAWPYRGDGVLRVRARASCLPVLATMAGASVPGLIDALPPPVVRPVRGAADLTVLIRAETERDALDAVLARLGPDDTRATVKLARWAELWVARVAGISGRRSMVLQGLVEGSPLGLFVPA